MLLTLKRKYVLQRAKRIALVSRFRYFGIAECLQQHPDAEVFSLIRLVEGHEVMEVTKNFTRTHMMTMTTNNKKRQLNQTLKKRHLLMEARGHSYSNLWGKLNDSLGNSSLACVLRDSLLLQF